MKNNSLDNWYRDGFEQSPGSPPDFVWDNIAAELDEKPLFIWWQRILVAAVVLLCLGGVASSLFFSEEIHIPAPQLAHYGEKEAQQELMQAVNLNHVPVVLGSQKLRKQNANPSFAQALGVSDDHGLDVATHTLAPSLHSTTIAPQSTSQKVNALSRKVNLWQELQKVPLLEGEFQSKLKQAIELRLFQPYNDQGLKLAQGYFIGAQMNFTNLWALNYDTYGGFDRDSETYNANKFGNDFGIMLGANVNDWNAWQAEFTLHKRRGQAFNRYEEGAYVQNNVTLNYAQLNFLYKRKHPHRILKDRFPTSFNMLAGPYLAYMRSANLMRNGVDNNVEDHYTDYDAGLEFGVEYEIQFSKRLTFSAGARSSIGLTNIYAGNGKIPRDFNRTYNLAVGANFGIKYALGQ